MKIKIWHLVLTIFIICGIFMYLLIQPFIFWYIAVNRPITPEHIDKYYTYSANTSIFKFQKEFTYDWIASNATYVIKDYDAALEYIDKLDNLNINMYKGINIIRKFHVYKTLKDYDKALEVAKLDEKFRNKFEMEVYCETGDYQKAKEAYNKYWNEYSLKHPNYKNNPLKYYYLAKVEYSGKQYDKAYTAINNYFKNNKNSAYIAAWQLKADIAQKQGKQKEFEVCSQKVKELKEMSDKFIKKSTVEMNNEIVKMFKFKEK